MPKRSSDSARRRPVSRRRFLAVGSLSVVGLSAAERAARIRAQLGRGPKAVVLVLLNGGASSFETFDPKPAAPKEIRGPYRAIETSVPGVQVSELLPKLAQRANQFAIVRTLHHQSAPIHETGLQHLHAGATATRTNRPAALGSLLQFECGYPERSSVPAYVVTPGRFAMNGRGPLPCDGGGDHAQALPPAIVDDGVLVEACPAEGDEPRKLYPGAFRDQPHEVRDAYGNTQFGRRLWNARQLVEHGASWVTVNLFDHLEGSVTWDAHGARSAPATLGDYARTLCPHFDRAMSAFLDDLTSTGLMEDVLVICTGEMGRTPRVNARGGRDHWTKCWSGLVAGGRVAGGTVIGQSDARGMEPMERPVQLRDLSATALASAIGSLPDGLPQLAGSQPLAELEPKAARPA
jgi:uncharacterized protein (DUF1501 family)